MAHKEPPYKLEQEAIDDFLDSNLIALKNYISEFDNCIHCDCEHAIAGNAQKNIDIYVKRLGVISPSNIWFSNFWFSTS